MLTLALAEDGGDPRERAGLVGDLDLQDRDAGADRSASAPSPSRARFAASKSSSTPARAGSAICGTEGTRRSTNRSIAERDLVAIRERISLQRAGCDAASRVRSRNPPAASEQDLGLVRLLRGREAHQGRRGDLRKVADERDQPVVPLGVHPTGRAPSRPIHASTASTPPGPCRRRRRAPRRSRRRRRPTRVRGRSARCRPSGGPARSGPCARRAPSPGRRRSRGS